MKNKILPVILGFMLVFSLMFVASANIATLVTPAQDGSVSGSTYTMNVTLDTNGNNYQNATFWYDDGSSNTTIGRNDTAVDTSTVFTITWDSTGIVDVNDLTFWVSVTNANQTINTSDSSTGVDVDNGNPTATLNSTNFDSVTQGYNVKKGEVFKMAIDQDNTIGISSAVIFCTDLQDSTVKTSTISCSSNGCSNTTMQPESFLTKGRAYNCLIQATDGNNDHTNSSTRRLNYLQATSGSGGSSPKGIPEQASGTVQSITGNIFSGESFRGFGSSIGNFFKAIWDTITFWK